MSQSTNVETPTSNSNPTVVKSKKPVPKKTKPESNAPKPVNTAPVTEPTAAPSAAPPTPAITAPASAAITTATVSTPATTVSTSQTTASTSQTTAPTYVAGKIKTRNTKIDPNAPKRPSTAFILFSQDNRQRVKLENPSALNTDIFKILGGKWQAADAATKAKYETLYNESKAIADEQSRAYAQTDSFKSFRASLVTNSVVPPTVRNETTKKAKKVVDPNAPKRPISTFILFSNAERECVKRELPSATTTQLSKRLGEKWQAADAATKAKYDALYRDSKSKAAAETLAYEQTDSFKTFATNASSVSASNALAATIAKGVNANTTTQKKIKTKTLRVVTVEVVTV